MAECFEQRLGRLWYARQESNLQPSDEKPKATSVQPSCLLHAVALGRGGYGCFVAAGWGDVVVDMSLWVIGVGLAVFAVVRWLVVSPKSLFHKYEVVKLDIPLGNVGSVELRPNNEDVQIAHRIWTELMTRKAAQPIDMDHDVIVEIYNSWYALFGRVRQLISDIPGHLVRKEKSTQELVRIATQTLNEGLRPHLTRWQARFRHWYDSCPDEVKKKCPQDCQKILSPVCGIDCRHEGC